MVTSWPTGQRLLEVGPELLGILEPDREPEQARRDPVSLPAVARLELRARAAEARRVLDRASIARSTRPRGFAVGDVERDEEREPRVAHGRRPPECAASALGEDARRSPPDGRGASRASRARGGRARPCRPRRRSPRAGASRCSRSRSSGSRVTVTPASTSSWPGEDLRRRVEHDVAARARAAGAASGDATVASQTTGAGWAAAASRSGIVSSGFAGASTRIRSTLVRRRPGLVELDDVHAPGREVVEEHAMAVVRALGERDRAARAQHRQDDGRDRAHPGRVEERVAAVERAEGFLAGDPRRMVGARVREPARLAVLVRPGRRAVQWCVHRSMLSAFADRASGGRMRRWSRRRCSARVRAPARRRHSAE